MAIPKYLLSKRVRNNLILRAVQHQHRACDPPDMSHRIKLVTHENQSGKNRKNYIGHIPGGAEAGFENQSSGLDFRSKFRRHGAAEGATEQDDILLLESSLAGQVTPRGPGVLYNPFSLVCPGFALTPVVEDEDIQAKSVKDFNRGAAMGDIARIAVKKQQRPFRSMMRDVPAVQAQAIRGIQEDILIGESPLRRCLVKPGVREKDHRGLLQVHPAIQQGQPKQQEKNV